MQDGSLGLTLREVNAADLPVGNRMAIGVIRTCPGFPAFIHLHPGDLIVGVNHEPLVDDVATLFSRAFQAKVQGHHPGEPIVLDVVREGKRMPVRFAVAPMEALRTLYPSDSMDLGLAGKARADWAVRRSELQSHDPYLPPLIAPPPDDADASEADAGKQAPGNDAASAPAASPAP
jgi:hypothetical protein